MRSEENLRKSWQIQVKNQEEAIDRKIENLKKEREGATEKIEKLTHFIEDRSEKIAELLTKRNLIDSEESFQSFRTRAAENSATTHSKNEKEKLSTSESTVST